MSPRADQPETLRTDRATDDQSTLGADRADLAMRCTRWLAILWGLLTMLFVAGTAAFLTDTAVRLEGPFLPAAGACLLCVSLIVPSVRTVRDIWISPAYPMKYWTRAVATLLSMILFTLIFGAWVVTELLLSVFRDSPPRHAAVALGSFMFWLLLSTMIVHGILSRTGISVTPYFESSAGELDVYSEGQYLARHLRDLDELARAAGVTPLSDFGWGDDQGGRLGVPTAWHPSASGLKTVNTLLAQLEGDEFGGSEQAGLLDDLKRTSHALGFADSQGIRFCLFLTFFGPMDARARAKARRRRSVVDVTGPAPVCMDAAHWP